MLIWMLDSLPLYRNDNAGLVPLYLLISHWIPVLSGSNTEVITTQRVPSPKCKKGLYHPMTQRKKKKKKKKKKAGRGSYLCESSLRGSAC